MRPDAIAQSIAAVTLGASAMRAVPLAGSLRDYAGTYAGVGRGGRRVARVAVDSASHSLVFHPGDGPDQALTYLGAETFGHDETRLVFVRQAGRVAAVRVDEVYGFNILARQR
jgi:hypothetical protein